MAEGTGTRVPAREAMEFAPGLLAIQESPPAVLPRAVLITVIVLFFILLTWALFGQLDVVASADGRLIPKSYVKIVQPAESGIVQDILVTEGQRVKAGQVMIRMDSKDAEADIRTIKSELALKSLQLRRIEAELVGKPLRPAEGDPPALYAQVHGQYHAHRQSYADALAQEKATLEKAKHDLESAVAVLHKLRRVVPMYGNSAAAFERLAGEGYVGPLAAQEKERDRVEKEQDLKAQLAAVESGKAAVAASKRRVAQITSDYRSRLQNERIDAEGEYKKLSEQWIKLAHKRELLELRAPQAGIVKELATHTIGTVVSPGTVLVTLVPEDEALLAEVFVKNEDAGFVHAGQRAKVKLAAFPFQKYGMVDGTVDRVGPDAMDGASSSQQPAEGDKQQGMLQYKAIVRLDTQHLRVDDEQFDLSPGMQLVAEIHLGKRTVMEYLLSPIEKAWHEAARER